MPSRRTFLASASAVAAAGALPAFAQNRPNPMPDQLRQALERSAFAPVLGNPDGNITLTQFFDYNCPFCRKMMPVIPRLIAADPRLRIVYREVPVFGDDSEGAARVSLATLRQSRYWPFHEGLMTARGRASEASAMRVAADLGLDQARLRTDKDSQEVSDHIALSFQLAEHMGLVGTPTFIAGDEAVFGEMSLTELQNLIARARQTMGVI